MGIKSIENSMLIVTEFDIDLEEIDDRLEEL